MRRLLALGAVALLAGCGGTKTVTVTVPTTPSAAACTGGDLSGTFDVVEGSAGAGNLSYRLTLTNTSGAPCSVSGIPGLRLLDGSGNALPTKVIPVEGKTETIVLNPSAAATTEARFSPDVPGTGEQTAGPCEPTAAQLRVTLAGGSTLVAPIVPVTPVCEHGTLSVAPLS